MFYIYSENFDSILPNSSTDKDIRSSWGAFGDFFGGALNPIFAFLGLIMLAVTLRLNLIELSLSRQELTETRKEIAASSAALSSQANSQQLQNFENTLFRILDLYNNNVNSLSSSGPKAYKNSGRACFNKLSDELKKNISLDKALKVAHSTESVDILALEHEARRLSTEIEKLKTALGMVSLPNAIEKLGQKRKRLNEIEELLFDHNSIIRDVDDTETIAKVFNSCLQRQKFQSINQYLSTLESLLSYVYEQDNETILKSTYYDLIRSQMSIEEAYCLFYSLISNPTLEHLKFLCTEAALLKKLNPEDFTFAKNHWQFYEKRAFGF